MQLGLDPVLPSAKHFYTHCCIDKEYLPRLRCFWLELSLKYKEVVLNPVMCENVCVCELCMLCV